MPRPECQFCRAWEKLADEGMMVWNEETGYCPILDQETYLDDLCEEYDKMGGTRAICP